MTRAYRISDVSISVMVKNRFRTLASNNPNFPALRDYLKSGGDDDDHLASLVDIPAFVAMQTHGRVTINNDEVRFDDKPVHSHLADRMLTHFRNGDPIEPLANLMTRLEKNPNESVRDDLFLWLEAGNMPLTDDGFIIGWKKVQGDYYSVHSGKDGKVLHAIGTTVKMDREDCDPNRNNACSTGLHFCSYDYLSFYAGADARVLIVKIDPANVTAIPNEAGNQKGRCCEYDVVGEVPYEEAAEYFGKSMVFNPNPKTSPKPKAEKKTQPGPKPKAEKKKVAKKSKKSDKPRYNGFTVKQVLAEIKKHGSQRGAVRAHANDGWKRSSLYDFLKVNG